MTLLKVWAICTLACITVFGVASVALVGYVVSGGIATVSVDTNGADFSVPVPMRNLDLGLGVAGMTVPASELRATQAELQTQLRESRPVLEEIADQLHHFPEGELIRVVTENELVVVRHTRGKFHVEVITPDAHVKVAVPRRAMSRLVRKTLALGGPWDPD
jgi:hypothetical protein